MSIWTERVTRWVVNPILFLITYYVLCGRSLANPGNSWSDWKFWVAVVLVSACEANAEHLGASQRERELQKDRT